MKGLIISILAFFVLSAYGFVPASQPYAGMRRFELKAEKPKPTNMEEILARFPDDKPVLINFYDKTTEKEIYRDNLMAKRGLKDRCTIVNITQQDYPEIAKVWDADEKSPSMILFKEGNPVMRLYEVTDAMDIIIRVGAALEKL
mmetsp:Transcript_13383/g.20373  ORF Transcript_13383/g.20373 Transcript_13383/m.20373 type:complete len:144 (+) Transcript_13383:141-572(+)